MNVREKLNHIKDIGVLGLGVSGLSAYKFFKKYNITVTCWDDFEDTRLKFRSLYQSEDLENYINWNNKTHILISPGIPLTGSNAHPIVEFAKKHNIKIVCDYEILYHLKKDESKFIAVTGTNGKSTTTSFIYHILKESGKSVSLGGNIGVSVLELDLNSDFFVLELSSYQLESLDQFKPDIALILNITKDHLERHLTMENYIDAKFNIFKNQDETDIKILGVDSDILFDKYKDNKCYYKTFSLNNNADIYINNNMIKVNNNNFTLPLSLQNFNKVKLLNFLASYLTCNYLGVDNEIICNAAISFRDLKHRMQYLGKIKNCNFYNDSKATNAESTLPALTSLKNIFWIAGGVPKEGGIKILQNNLSNIKNAYYIGKAKDMFEIQSKEQITNIKKYSNLEDAFQASLNDATSFSEECNIVLSPACSSFDLFKNFEDRGDVFIDLFNKYKKLYE